MPGNPKQSQAWQHQQEFVDAWSAGSHARRILVAPPGTGGAYTVLQIVSRTVREDVTRSVLMLAPAPLVHEYRSRLADDLHRLVEVVAVDRVLFREMISQPESPWRRSTVYLLSIDLAKQPDIAASLLAASWGLAVVDGSLSLGGQRKDLVAGLIASDSCERFLLWVDFIERVESDYRFQPLVRTTWNPAELRGRTGERLIGSVEARVFSYERGEREVKLIEATQAVDETLTRAALSSPSALERAVRRRKAALVPGPEWPYGQDDEDIVRSHDTIPSASMEVLDSILGRIDDLTSDAKLEGLTRAIGTLFSTGETHVALFTRYRETARYLNAALSEHFENVGAPTVFETYGGLTEDARFRARGRFAEHGGVLILTDAAPAFGTRRVHAAIHYDLAPNNFVLRRRTSQLLLAERRDRPAISVTLHDTSKVGQIEGALAVETSEEKS